MSSFAEKVNNRPWGGLEVQIPNELESIIEPLEKITDAIIQLLEILKTIIKALAELAILTLNATQAIIKAALDAIQAAIEALLNDAGLYVLFVPIRKKVILAPVVREALFHTTGQVKLPPVSFDIQNYPFLYEGKTVTLADPTAVSDGTGVTEYDPILATYLQSAMAANGGNAGFLRTVVESLYDEGDASRPKFDSTAAVGGVYIVAGAPDFFSLANLLLAFLSLFAPRTPATALDIPGTPVPTNLRARVVASEKSTEASCLLNWDSPPPISYFPAVDAWVALTGTCVVRSKSPALMSKTTLQEIFGPRASSLEIGDKEGTGDSAVEVVQVLNNDVNDVFVSNYLDSGLEKKAGYYYAASFSYRSAPTLADLTNNNTAGATKVHGFGTLSNVVKVYTEEVVPRSTQGIAPDWIRTPRLLDLIPEIGYVVRQILAALEQLGDYVTGFADMLKAYVQFLEEEIISYGEFVEGIVLVVKRLLALVKALKFDVGVYTNSFAGIGGNTFLMQDLARKLAPSYADTNELRPPFDTGNEYVTGVVIMAAGPSLATIQPVLDLLDFIFNFEGRAADRIQSASDATVTTVGSQVARAKTERNVILAAIESIGTAIEEAEQRTFTVDLTADFTSPPVQATRQQPLVGEEDTGNGVLDQSKETPVLAEFSEDMSTLLRSGSDAII